MKASKRVPTLLEFPVCPPRTHQPFTLGRLVTTRSVSDLSARSTSFAQFTIECLVRHKGGDWGDMCNDDKRSNDVDSRSGRRLLSAYTIPADVDVAGWPGDSKLWIITEGDRSSTTVLWPSEY
jgi:hypothetical protein